MPWSEVPCRDTVKTAVARSSEKGMLRGAYLIYGPPSAGQYDVGRAIAMTMLCDHAEHDYCGECSVCRRILAKTHPDYIELTPENDWEKPERKGRDYSVGHMRMVMEFARIEPHEGSCKLFMMHDAHRMNLAAANSLLKVLEEPHKRLIFILLTDNLSAILPTIRSRCQRIRLGAMPSEGVIAQLGGLERAQAETLARAAGGLPQRAQELADDGYLDERNAIIELLNGVLNSEFGVYEGAERLAKERDRLRDRLTILAGVLRDVALASSGCKSGPFYNPDRAADILSLHEANRSHDWVASAEKIWDAIEDLDRNLNPSILITELFSSIRSSVVARR